MNDTVADGDGAGRHLRGKSSELPRKFNALIFGVASGISNLDAAHGVLAEALFLFGAASAVMALLASRTQQGYYKQARNALDRN